MILSDPTAGGSLVTNDHRLAGAAAPESPLGGHVVDGQQCDRALQGVVFFFAHDHGLIGAAGFRIGGDAFFRGGIIRLHVDGAGVPDDLPGALLAHGVGLRLAGEIVKALEGLQQLLIGGEAAQTGNRQRKDDDRDANREHQLNQREARTAVGHVVKKMRPPRLKSERRIGTRETGRSSKITCSWGRI
ncbi:MAG: hypothetical protein WDN28_14625 [Chthoniobacter sp.]